MNTKLLAESTMINMGAMALIYQQRAAHAALTAGTIIQCDTRTLVNMVDPQFLEMHYEIHEALKKSNTLSSKFTRMNRMCNLYRYMETLRKIAGELNIGIDEELAQSISKFAKTYSKL